MAAELAHRGIPGQGRASGDRASTSAFNGGVGYSNCPNAPASAIQLLTGYFTEVNRRPVKDIGQSSETGPATVILSGVSFGMEPAMYAAMLIAGAVFGLDMAKPKVLVGRREYVTCICGQAMAVLGRFCMIGLLQRPILLGRATDRVGTGHPLLIRQSDRLTRGTRKLYQMYM